MKKKTKIFLIIALIFFLITTSTRVLNYIFESPKIGGYEVESITKTINVSEDNIYNVTDTYNVNFTKYNNLIEYKIPLKEKESKFKISNIKVSGLNSKNSLKVKVGKVNPDIAVINVTSDGYIGRDTISVKYTLDKGEDFDKTKDIFSMNLLDNMVARSISSISFTINFPKPISENNVHFFSEIDKTKDFTYKVSGSTIEGKYIGKRNLMENTSIIVNTTEGYFKGERNYKTNDLIIKLTFGFITLIFLIIWFIKGKDDKISPAPCFGAPNNMNPLEIGYWIDGSVEFSDMFYQVLSWANEGYVTIEKLTKKYDVDGKTNFVIRKRKELDINKPEYEKILFNAMFELGRAGEISLDEDYEEKFDTYTFRTETDALYGTLQTYAENTYNAEENFKESVKDEEQKGYDPSAEKAFKVMKSCCLIFWIVAMYIFSLNNALTFVDYMPMITVIVTVMMGMFVPKDAFLKYIVWSMPMLLIMTIKTVDIVVLAMILVSLFITAFVRKRTFEYNELLGKIYGFRNVITKSKYKKEINDIASNCDTYFYEVLPYAFVLYKEKEWVNQFDTITTPFWYISKDGNGLDKTNINEFLKQFRMLCSDVLQIVNMSVDADKKKEAREGVGYVTASDRIKDAGLSMSDFEEK